MVARVGEVFAGIVATARAGVPGLAQVEEALGSPSVAGGRLDTDHVSFVRKETGRLERDARAWRLAATLTGVATVVLTLMGAMAVRPAWWNAGTPGLTVALPAGVAGLAWILVILGARKRGRVAAAQASVAEELEVGAGDDALAIARPWWPWVVLIALAAMGVGGAAAALAIPDNRDDSPGRVLVLADGPDQAGWLLRTFGFEAEQRGPVELLDHCHGREDAVACLVRQADLQGYGFLALDLEARFYGLDGRPDVIVPSPVPDARFAVLSIGDMARPDHGGGLAAPGPGRLPWVAADPSTASFGVGPDGFADPAAARVALARALFAQPAFAERGDEEDRPAHAQRGKSAALLWGQMYFGLPADFWSRALLAYDDMEAALDRGESPRGWDVD